MAVITTQKKKRHKSFLDDYDKQLKREYVTLTELYDIVTDRQGCTFGAYWACTVPSMKDRARLTDGKRTKTYRNPFLDSAGDSKIYCLTHGVLCIGHNHVNSVNNALSKQGFGRTYTNSGEPWGDRYLHDHDAAVVVGIDTGLRYLHCKVQQRTRDFRRGDARKIEYRLVEPFLETNDVEGILTRRYSFANIWQVQMRMASDEKSKVYTIV